MLNRFASARNLRKNSMVVGFLVGLVGWCGGRLTHKERCFQSAVHSSNDCKNQAWVALKAGALEYHLGLPCGSQGSKASGHRLPFQMEPPGLEPMFMWTVEVAC